MNYIDIIIILLLIASAVHGYKKGLIHELASLASFILGIYLAIKFSGWVADKLQYFLSQNTAFIVAFIIIFLLVSMSVFFIGKMLEKTFEEAELGPINKLAGVLFNIAKTVIVLSVLIFVFNFFQATRNWPSQKTREESFLFTKIESVAPSIYPLVMNKVKEEDKK
jgi:membrane protein required for colicin V production